MPTDITWSLHALSITKCRWDLSSKPSSDQAEVTLKTDFGLSKNDREDNTIDLLAKFRCVISENGHSSGFIEMDILAEFDLQGDYEVLRSIEASYDEFKRETASVVNGHVRNQLIKICADAGLEDVILLPLSRP